MTARTLETLRVVVPSTEDFNRRREVELKHGRAPRNEF